MLRLTHRAPVIGICAKFRICSFTVYKNQNRKRRKTAWNKGLTAKRPFWNARWPEKRKRLLKRLSAWYNEGYKKDVRILCVADCRQKAILPPKGENSPFRKWKNSWISWFCYSSQVCLCQQAVRPQCGLRAGRTDERRARRTKSLLLRHSKYQLLIQRLVLFFYPMVAQKPLWKRVL